MVAAVGRIYYGWYMVAVAQISGAFQAGVGIWGLGVFAFPMEAEFGWSRASFFLALTIRTALTGLLSPLVGPWRDTRRGPRVLMLGGAVLLSFSLMALRWTDSLWEFYLYFGVLGGIASQGSGGIMTQAILPKWFVRHRGRAMGIASTGGAMGPLFFPISIYALIELVGWRDAWFLLGVISLIVLVPLSFLVYTRPEDRGLHPDGDPAPPPAPSPDAPATPGAPAVAATAMRRRLTEVSLTGREALKTPAFWLIVVAFAVGGLGQQGFWTNWLPYMEGKGIDAGVGALAITVYGICSTTARIPWGLLSERYPVRNLIVINSLMTASSVLLLIYVLNLPMLFLFMVCFGLTMGGNILMRPLIVANYFGREHLGAITGYMRPFQAGTTAIGPVAVAWAYDVQGSYFWSFVAVMIGFSITAAVIALAAPPKAQRERTAGAGTGAAG